MCQKTLYISALWILYWIMLILETFFSHHIHSLLQHRCILVFDRSFNVLHVVKHRTVGRVDLKSTHSPHLEVQQRSTSQPGTVKWHRWHHDLSIPYRYLCSGCVACPNSHPNRLTYNVLLYHSFLSASIGYRWCFFFSCAKTYVPTGQLGNLPLKICGRKWTFHMSWVIILDDQISWDPHGPTFPGPSSLRNFVETWTLLVFLDLGSQAFLDMPHHPNLDQQVCNHKKNRITKLEWMLKFLSPCSPYSHFSKDSWCGSLLFK